MDGITMIWNNILASIQLYAPSIIGAIVLIIVAWVVATILRAIVVRVLDAVRFDARFGRSVGDPNTMTPLSKTIGNVVFWLVILLFLPAILGALNLPGILLPVQNMINTALAFLPNIIAAVAIFVIGWFVASIVKRVLVSIFDAVGVDRLAARFGISQALGSQRLSNVLATIVYFIILIPVLIAALNALQLDAITAPASAMLNNILLAIPNIFAAFLLLAIAYIAARVVAGLVTSVLTALGFNRLLAAIGLGRAQAAVD
ncbi:MAG TPA: mechanosensitive ion channel, partial [Anaerolineae bacterium]|nr:mechanosensitive ion channel [Anaerolineae bacterium]